MRMGTKLITNIFAALLDKIVAFSIKTSKWNKNIKIYENTGHDVYDSIYFRIYNTYVTNDYLVRRFKVILSP